MKPHNEGSETRRVQDQTNEEWINEYNHAEPVSDVIKLPVPEGAFKLIIAGGRDFIPSTEDLEKIDLAISHYYNISEMEHLNGGLEMVSGLATGADQIPFYYKAWHGVPVKEFKADWNLHGKKAGILRNIEMAKYSDALIIFWNGRSKGSKHMIDIAKKEGLKVKVYNYG